MPQDAVNEFQQRLRWLVIGLALRRRNAAWRAFMGSMQGTMKIW